jgi:hypothetical protein
MQNPFGCGGCGGCGCAEGEGIGGAKANGDGGAPKAKEETVYAVEARTIGDARSGGCCDGGAGAKGCINDPGAGGL